MTTLKLIMGKDNAEARDGMSFNTLSQIWDRQQKEKAKTALGFQARAKQSLTMYEKLNKFAQIGGVIMCDDIALFTYQQGWGILVTPTKKIYGATLMDFINIIKK